MGSNSNIYTPYKFIQYEPGFMVDSNYPFSILDFYIEDGYETESVTNSLTNAQYIQSKRWAKDGKSEKRVQKHLEKMRYIEEHFPDVLL